MDSSHTELPESAAFVVLDADGRIARTTDAFCALVGRSQAEVRGLSWSDFVLRLPEVAAAIERERARAEGWEPDGQGRVEDEPGRLRRALEAHRWNASQTARVLGISRTTLWRRMRRSGLLPAR